MSLVSHIMSCYTENFVFVHTKYFLFRILGKIPRKKKLKKKKIYLNDDLQNKTNFSSFIKLIKILFY